MKAVADWSEALTDAVATIRLKDCSLTAKEVHLKLCQQTEWADVSLSSVKKVCSKVGKQMAEASTQENGSAAEPHASPSSASKGLRRVEQCSYCKTMAPDGVKYQNCELCVKEQLPNPACFCSPACFKKAWKSGGHKQYHEHMRTFKEQNRYDSAQIAQAEKDLGLDGSKDLSDDFDRLLAEGQMARVRGDNYTACKKLRKAIKMKPDEPLGYLCFGDNQSAGNMPLQACRAYDTAGLLFQHKGEEKLWAHAMLLAHDARITSTPCGNIFCNGWHFEHVCCKGSKLADLVPSWLSGKDPREFIGMGWRVIEIIRPKLKGPDYMQMDELGRFQTLMAHVGNMQQLGTCFVKGGKAEYASPEAESYARNAGFPVYGDCGAFGMSPRGKDSRSHGFLYKWVFGESDV